MALNFKRLLAYNLIKLLNASELIRRLYPLAMDIKFEKISQIQLLVIMNMIKISKHESYRLIRLGSFYDGGYVVIDDFSRRDVLVSLGIGDNAEFECNIANKIERVIAFDHTIDAMPETTSNIEFNKLGVKGKLVDNFVTLSSIIENIPAENDLLLKIDIEGWEWEVLKSISETEISRFRQIIGEFHGFSKAESLETINQVLTKILRNFIVVNVHANNWGKYDMIKRLPIADVIEITFVRKDSYESPKNSIENQRHKFNSKNNPSDLDLGFNLL
jgi:hypothetical protein